ncbi:MAG: SAM-dependent methyltransferase [Actinomycetota bacterium]|nr:SAM-dependent methyltransferase [Actinomycetota bacterium]
MSRDWREWHTAYDGDTPLTQRLAIVQARIADALDAAPPGPIRVISMCAGQGRDLLGVLADHPRRADVRARLVELDGELAAQARAAAPPGVDVVTGDASTTTAYAGAVPADLVLVCGVFGNIADTDIERTIRALPSLCAPGATVIWTRHRRPPDRTADARRWFAVSGFEEVAFDAPEDFLFGIGTNRYADQPQAFSPDEKLFTFVGYDTLP